MAAINMKLAGKVSVPWARLMVTILSSMGWRSTSRTRIPNSGSSSRKSTLCADIAFFRNNGHFATRVLADTLRSHLWVVAQLDVHQASLAGRHRFQDLPEPGIAILAMHTLGRAHPHPSAGAGIEPRHLALISLRKSSNGDFVNEAWEDWSKKES